MSDPIEYAFCAEGPLAQAIDNYRPREGQVAMAMAVDEAMRNYGLLVAEAGTGTGKTFAYLVPALMSGAKVIVSTGTKTLQDQLFDRDIPMVRSALRVPVSIAYPMLSIGYVVNALLAHYWFGELLVMQKALGIGFIIIGVILVANS